jgi:hypothetical protein
MGYIEDSLGQTESVLYRAQFPWVYPAAAWGSLILFGGIGIASHLWGYGWLRWIAPLAGIILFLSIMAPIWASEIGVTNQRVIYKRGLIRRSTSEIQVKSIEEVQLSQDVLGRLFDFGRVTVHGTGEGDIRLPNLADPIGLRKAMQNACAASQASPSVQVPRGWSVQQTAKAWRVPLARRRVGFAVTAAEAGADIRAIATVTRHRSLTMPARYAQKAEQIKTSPHRLAGVGLKR